MLRRQNGRFPCPCWLKRQGTASVLRRAIFRSVLVRNRVQLCLRYGYRSRSYPMTLRSSIHRVCILPICWRFPTRCASATILRFALTTVLWRNKRSTQRSVQRLIFCRNFCGNFVEYSARLQVRNLRLTVTGIARWVPRIVSSRRI